MSEHKTNKPAVTVVETQTPGKRFRASLPARRSLLKLVVISVVVLLAVFAVVKTIDSHQAAREAQANQPKKLSDKEYDKQQAALMGNGPASVKLAEQQQDDSMRRQIKLANAYANDKQYDKSLAIYDQQISKNSLSSDYIAGAAQIATVAGKKDKAIEYYKLAITKAKSEKGPLQQSSIDRYQMNITELSK